MNFVNKAQKPNSCVFRFHPKVNSKGAIKNISAGAKVNACNHLKKWLVGPHPFQPHACFSPKQHDNRLNIQINMCIHLFPTKKILAIRSHKQNNFKQHALGSSNLLKGMLGDPDTRVFGILVKQMEVKFRKHCLICQLG